MRTYKVTAVLQYVEYIEAESEDEALAEARLLYPAGLDEVVDETVEVDDDDVE